jgi:hypothetical protein
MPEMPGWPNLATFYPYQDPRHRERWNTSNNGGASTQLGISSDFETSEGTANNFWGLTVSSPGSGLTQ